MNFWWKVSAVLVAIWAVAGGVAYFAHSRQPTPDSIAAYIRRADIASKAGRDRAGILADVEAMLNRITLDERQELKHEGVTDGFFKQLTQEEQAAFLDATLPTGFRQMMESFNKMEPGKRRQFVDRALSEMRKHEGEQPARNLDDKNMQRMVDQGMKSFYSDASADTKLDLSPLIDQMQRNMQSR